MAHEASIVVGSGINPLKKLVPANETSHERHLRGTQVVLLNPEDGSAGGSGLVTAVTVGSSAIKLPTTPLKYRRAMSVYNHSQDTLYVGFGPGVTTGNGWPVAAGASIALEINAEVLLYGISDGTSSDVRILELS